MRKTENHEEEDYFGKIERRFNQLRGTPLLISPKDWALMSEWKKRGIPSIVVIEALEIGFEKAGSRKARRRPISTLSYFKHIIEDCWESFRESRIGKGEKKGEEIDHERTQEFLISLQRSLTGLSERLEGMEELSRSLKKVAEEISRILSSTAWRENELESLEERFSLWDDEVGDALLKCCNTAEMDRAGREAETEFSRMSKFMSPDSFEDIKRRYVIRKLRKKFGIPRISLFFH
ncbi:MAG: hypothetical protein AB1756_10775 [Acidobacteriota bacterium]